MRYQRTLYINEPLLIARIHNTQGSKTVISHQFEQCQLHIRFLDSLTEDEMESMYGSANNFFYRMSKFFGKQLMEEAYLYAMNKYNDSTIPHDIEESVTNFKNYISNISHGKATKTCIFCVGEYGIELYQELKNKRIQIDWFSDNNSQRWAEGYGGVPCIPPEQLKGEKDNTLVIVANRAPEIIVEQLKKLDFPYLTTKQEIDRGLFYLPPLSKIFK
ncbi:hypothetical protein [Paenibacillus sonchi]|nr:hypothetical protein [Paenibacillus sonchi]